MKPETQRIKYIVSDFFFAALMWFAFNVARFEEVAHHMGFMKLSSYITYFQVIKGQIFVPIFWLILSYYSGYYNLPCGKSRLAEFFTTFFTSVTGTLLLFFLIVLNDLPQNYAIYYRLFFFLLFVSFFFTYIPRLIITQRAAKKIRQREWTVKTLVIAKGEKADYITRLLVQPVDAVAYSIEGYANPDDPGDLSEIIQNKKVTELIISIDSTEDADIQRLLNKLYRYNLPVKLPLSNHKILTGGLKAKSITGVPLVDLSSNNFSEASKNIKKTIDKLTALLVLIILSPLYLFLAIRVKADSKGPVIFKQERIGYKGKPFIIYKFRTMQKDAEAGGPRLSSWQDERVTPFGRFMRKYRLDELPQFWNVLKGDMSLVGPRPERQFFIDQIVQKAPWFYLLQNIRPGITSWGMVKYGYASNVEEMVERMGYDIIYYENMSLFIDLKVLIYTIRTIFMGRGV